MDPHQPAGVEGADPIYGYGLVDAAAAVSATVPAVTANPMGDLGEWIRINRRAQAVTPEAETLAPTPSASATPGPEASGGGSNDGKITPAGATVANDEEIDVVSPAASRARAWIL